MHQTAEVDLREKALQAKEKPSPYGEDIDLKEYLVEAGIQAVVSDPSRLPQQARRDMLEVGVVTDSLHTRAGTFLQTNHTVIYNRASHEGVEMMSSLGALEKYPWLKDYWWKAVPVDTDKFTAHVELHPNQGYFIRTLPGAKIAMPVQACLYLTQPHLAQSVHNLIIVEEGSELHVITGCTVPYSAGSGLHIGVSEFYVKKGAKLMFTMIHNWAPEVAVRPRTGVIIDEGGTYISNYVSLRPTRNLQTYPTAWCKGRKAVAQFNSILLAPPGAKLDIGARVVLEAPEAKGEIVSRALTRGGKVMARGHLVGMAPGVKGHLECRGLILSDEGEITAIPELDGRVADVDLTHEAAVGKIAEEELEYLMARGLTRDEATSAIVKGFISMDIKGLPPGLETQLHRAIKLSQRQAL
ncbi:MAG: SufD family Fe-S cluster assembly protein [Chloroflexota bacterium]